MFYLFLCNSEVDEAATVGIDGGRGGRADLEAGVQRVDVVGVGYFGSSGIEQQIGIICSNDAACGVPDVPVAGHISALDQHEACAISEAAVDAERGAGAGVAADFADAGAGGEEVGDVI